MTTKAGYYGSDAKTNRFIDPKTNEAYFTLVNKTTGEVELYNEEFGADKRVGTLGEDGKWEYNGNWWGGANKNDRAFAEKIHKDGTLKDQATTTIRKDLVDSGESPADAQKKSKDLIKKNTGIDGGSARLSNVNEGVDAVAKAGESVVGTREKGFGAYVFPKSLRQGGDNGQDFLKFDMLKYQPKKFDKENFAFSERDTDRKSIGTVILPIPGGIQDGQSVSWGGQSMSPLDMAKANIALTTVLDGPGAAVGELGNMANNIADGFGDNKDALAAVIAGMASGGQQLLTRTTGAISNPNMELLFGGPELRTFSFQFLLAPRSKEEAMTAIQIIRFFKQGMSPIRTKTRLFMKSPHTFRLSYRNSKGDNHKYLNKFKECALGTFGVNYAPNGNYSTFEDGVMTAYQMTMSYRELNPIYNDDYGDDTPFPREIGF